MQHKHTFMNIIMFFLEFLVLTFSYLAPAEACYVYDIRLLESLLSEADSSL